MLGVLAVVCVFGRMSAAQARPCGSGDYDSCLMYKTAFYDQDATVDAQETYGVRERTGADRNRRQHRLPDLETGEPIADTQAIIANGTVIDEDADVVDREDHFTQHLADLFVNTDSEITSLQANDFEEPREYSGGSHDAYFALLSGMEMALVMPETCAFSIGGLLRDGV